MEEFKEQEERFLKLTESQKWEMFLNLEKDYINCRLALELAREALKYEIGFIEANHCNEEDKQLLLDKQALEAIEEALK